MTWTQAKAQGAGALEWELIIEGWPFRFCTDGLEVGVMPDGRERVHGLQQPTGTLTEKAKLASGLPEIGGFRVSIVDMDLRATEAFTTRPNKKDWLSTKLASSDLTFTSALFGSGSVFDKLEVLHIGTEAILYGTQTADRLTDSGDQLAFIHQWVSASASTQYTASIYVLKDEVTSRVVELTIDDDDTETGAIQLNTSDGSTSDRSSPDSSSVSDAGNHWRLTVTFTTGASATQVRLLAIPAVNTAFGALAASTPGSAVFFGAQLEQAASASAYEKTTVTAGTTNLLKRSENFLSSDWTKNGGVTVDFNYGQAPGETVGVGGTDESQRGYWDTTAQSHHVLAGDRLERPAMLDRPMLMQNRRVELHAYGPTELTLDDAETSVLGQGLSTRVWGGICRTEPQQRNAGEWSLGIDPVTKLLEQEIGSGVLDAPLQITGVYYSTTGPLLILVQESSDANPGAGSFTGAFGYVGFSADKSAFIDDLNTFLDSNVNPSLSGTLSASASVEGWHFVYQTASSDPRYVLVTAASQVDGVTDPTALFSAESSGASIEAVSVEADTTYRVHWLSEWARGFALRGEPRACYASPFTALREVVGGSGSIPLDNDPGTADSPLNVYLGNAGLLSSGDKMQWKALRHRLTEADREGDDTRELQLTESSTREVDTVDASTGKVALLAGGFVDNVFLPHDGHEVQVVADLTGDADGTDLASFRNNLISEAAEFANLGTVPFITDSDFAGWTTEVNGATGDRGWLKHRYYTFREPKELKEILEQEARIYGGFFRLDASGRLEFRRHRQVTPTESVTKVGDDADARLAEFGRIKINPDNAVNVVKIKTGWDPVEEEHVGDSFEIRAWQSISQLKKRRTLEIMPEIRVKEGHDVRRWDEALEIGGPVIGLFGTEYYYAEVPVSIQHFDVLVGEPVEVTDPQIPYDGERGAFAFDLGLKAIRGLVVAREWRVAEGTGQLTVYITGVDIAGYSPAGKVSSASDTSGGAGTSWDITLTNNHYAPSGIDDASFFEAGDEIEVYEWDTQSPTTHKGNVTGVSGDVVSVDLDSAWSGPSSGTADWRLLYGSGADVSSDGNADQLKYCLTADAGLSLVTDDSAREFAG